MKLQSVRLVVCVGALKHYCMGVVTDADEARGRAVKHLKDAMESLKQAHKELLDASDDNTWSEYGQQFKDTLLDASTTAITTRASLSKLVRNIE